MDPGKPLQNSLIESFNGPLYAMNCPTRTFDSSTDARRKLAIWRYDYNYVRVPPIIGKPNACESAPEYSTTRLSLRSRDAGGTGQFHRAEKLNRLWDFSNDAEASAGITRHGRLDVCCDN
ncbi:MAG: hypothetical protein DI547_14825 [Sphingobium sp.]|nr:MAG: hypothetical protein DI547_14825 [Sphingobium sp.]